MTTTRVRSHIAGEWVEGGGEEFDIVNPARRGDVVGRGRTCTPAELERAIAAARGAARSWAHTPAHERARYLSGAATRLEQDADTLGRELSREEGKTLTEGRGEVLRAAQILRFFAADADREAGEIYNSPRRGERILVSRRPVGVVAAITPFNFPIAIPAWKIAPALAYGNIVLFKPASAVPLLAMRLVEALVDAGLPAGVLQLVLGNSEIGGTLVEHPHVDAVTFTGSTTVGRRLGARCAELGKAFQGEMGGKNAAIVLADADLDLAVDQVTSGAFRSTGQKCTATSRVIVEEGVADAFLAKLAARAGELVVGDPLAEGTYLGPVIDSRAQESLLEAIEGGRAAGLREVFGRPRYADGELAEGWFVSPTIFELDADSDRELWERELFGPVLVVRRAASRDEAVALANDSEFGLSGAVFTRDIASMSEILEDWNVGILHVNSETPGADPHVPFGGVKGSGSGPKEQGRAAREFFTESTTVYLRG